MVDANCRNYPADWFFPEDRGIHGRKQAEKAALVCGQCPVRVECSQYQKATSSGWGVWAGKAHRTSTHISEGGPRPTRGAA